MERAKKLPFEIAPSNYKDYISWQEKHTFITVDPRKLAETFTVVNSGAVPMTNDIIDEHLAERRDLKPVIDAFMLNPELKSSQYRLGAVIMKDTLELQFMEHSILSSPELEETIWIKRYEKNSHILGLRPLGNMLELYRKRYRAMENHTQPAFKELHKLNPTLLSSVENVRLATGMIDTFDIYNIAEGIHQKRRALLTTDRVIK